jgi:hypothetical protein
VNTIAILPWVIWEPEVSLAGLVVAVVVTTSAVAADSVKRIAILPWVCWEAQASLAGLVVAVPVAIAAAMADSAKKIVILPRVRWGAQASLAGLVVVLVMAISAVTAEDAHATPIYSTCYDGGNEVGYYEWYDDGQGNFTDGIYINECALDAMGAGPLDRQRVVQHELGHADGHDHSSDPYNVMYPQMVIWGI